VTDAKIVSVSGAKVTGAVASATNAATATNSTQLGGVDASQYLQANGNGSGLTNLNASAITTGTLANARLGQIPTANIADNAVTAPKIASGQVVKSITSGASTLTDNVTLAAGSNITITPAGNTLTIASTGGTSGVTGGGTVGRIPLFNGASVIGDSIITQTPNTITLPGRTDFAQSASGHLTTIATPNAEAGITFSGLGSRADIRYNGKLKLVNGVDGGPPSETSGIAINQSGSVAIGIDSFFSKLTVANAVNLAIRGISGDEAGSNISGIAAGVYGFSNSNNGRGVWGDTFGGTGVVGQSFSGVGVSGVTASTSPLFPGVKGESTGTGGVGVRRIALNGTGVYGATNGTTVATPGVHGVSFQNGGVGVRGDGTTGVYGRTDGGVGVTGEGLASGTGCIWHKCHRTGRLVCRKRQGRYAGVGRQRKSGMPRRCEHAIELFLVHALQKECCGVQCGHIDAQPA